jgi:hypothetical protein
MESSRVCERHNDANAEGARIMAASALPPRNAAKNCGIEVHASRNVRKVRRMPQPAARFEEYRRS